MSNNYELPPNPPSGGSGIEPSPTEHLNQILLSMLESSPQKTESENKEFLCPFRKRTNFMDYNDKGAWRTLLERAFYTEEEFLPCLKEKCAMWHSIDNFGFCGMQS